jgi:hypothetical protein
VYRAEDSNPLTSSARRGLVRLAVL